MDELLGRSNYLEKPEGSDRNCRAAMAARVYKLQQLREKVGRCLNERETCYPFAPFFKIKAFQLGRCDLVTKML